MIQNTMVGKAREISTRMKTLKVDILTWDSLKSLKRENETFNDVIKSLLDQRTKAIGNDNINAIKYQRKTGYLTVAYSEEIGVEYEYNDVKGNKEDFILDVTLKKVFFRKKIYSPSQFFGVDNAHKHFSLFFIDIYFHALELALMKEFKINVLHQPANIVYWKQLYNDYRLSGESFTYDVEDLLKLNIDEKPSKEWNDKMKNSLATQIIKERGIIFS